MRGVVRLRAPALGLGLALGLAACAGAERQAVVTPAPAVPVAAEAAAPPLPDRVAIIAAACSGCHASGNAVMAGFEGQTREALEATLLAYRNDPAGTSAMHRIARGYSAEDLAAIAAYLTDREAS